MVISIKIVSIHKIGNRLLRVPFTFKLIIAIRVSIHKIGNRLLREKAYDTAIKEGYLLVSIHKIGNRLLRENPCIGFSTIERFQSIK